MGMDSKIENAFENTTKILFGRKLDGVNEYEKWLKRNIREIISQKSVLSDNHVVMADFAHYLETKERVAAYEEYLELGKQHLSKEEVKNLSLENAAEKLKNISCYSPDQHLGLNVGMEECALYYNSFHCYRTYGMVKSKYCAYCFWPRQSEYAFGCSYLFSSKFCMKCYHSINLNRCFEVSNSTNCNDLYFSHNCENVHDSMFCFNAKNLRHAIGNKALPKEVYYSIKKSILEQILKELETEKDLWWDIYNIGCLKS